VTAFGEAQARVSARVAPWECAKLCQREMQRRCCGCCLAMRSSRDRNVAGGWIRSVGSWSLAKGWQFKFSLRRSRSWRQLLPFTIPGQRNSQLPHTLSISALSRDARISETCDAAGCEQGAPHFSRDSASLADTSLLRVNHARNLRLQKSTDRLPLVPPPLLYNLSLHTKRSRTGLSHWLARW
jgi:hypothetical protein